MVDIDFPRQSSGSHGHLTNFCDVMEIPSMRQGKMRKTSGVSHETVQKFAICAALIGKDAVRPPADASRHPASLTPAQAGAGSRQINRLPGETAPAISRDTVSASGVADDAVFQIRRAGRDRVVRTKARRGERPLKVYRGKIRHD